jgi:hypothetical protein
MFQTSFCYLPSSTLSSAFDLCLYQALLLFTSETRQKPEAPYQSQSNPGFKTTIANTSLMVLARERRIRERRMRERCILRADSQSEGAR